MAYTTINKSTEHFNTKLYTGDGTTNRGITGVGFQPDLTWIKARSDTTWHHLFDAVRGANKALNSNVTNAGGTVATFPSFDSDGFTVNGANAGNLNISSQTNASWNWKANGAGSANTDGDINSTVSVNTTSGFSIVKFTPTGSVATIGHGLGVAPKMIIVKNLGGSSTWSVYHSSLGATKFLRLEDTSAVGTEAGWWNNTTPTSSVFTLSSNINAVDTIAYCFAEKQGFSKFGSYTGNGNADGTFVYTGFKPAFVMVKNSSATADWVMLDDKRSTVNETAMKRLFPNDSRVEESGAYLDMLSNGFKMRTSGTDNNGSGNTLIYMAFAEAPLVGTNNVPCTAR